MNNPLLVIAGPTASGKSALAMDIAKKYNGEIICADSRTVYKGMNIGTAKPTAQDQLEVPHHLLDIVEPNQPFSAADFKQLANEAIQDISTRGKLPMLVGGTGLYIDAVIFDYQFGKPADPSRRKELQAMDVEQLQQLCHEQAIALPVNERNKRHLVRAIELGGVVEQEKKLRANTLVVAVKVDREVLRQRITARLATMISDGVLDEVKKLGERYGWESEAMKGNIYRIMHAVVDGAQSLKEGERHIITSDMQLAKRQMTWFKRNSYIVWGDTQQLTIAIEHFLHQNELVESMPLTA